MQRLFEKSLFDWKKSGMKKPLMVVGARQITIVRPAKGK